MAKILVTDLDGTLFYPKKRIKLISKKNLIFLRSFIDAGNHLVVASGRNFNDAIKVSKKIQRPLTFIGCNSALIIENGKIVYENVFDPQVILDLMDTIEEKFDPSNYVLMSEKSNCLIYARKYKLAFRLLYPFWAASQGVYKEKYKIVRKETFINEIKNGKIFKVMCFFGIGHRNSLKASIISKYLAKYVNLEVNWSSISIEFNLKGNNKAAGIYNYLKMHNFNKEDVYVVGDSGNDVCMFKEFYEHSFCMEHSNSSIKKYAKTIVKNLYDVKQYILEGENK